LFARHPPLFQIPGAREWEPTNWTDHPVAWQPAAFHLCARFFPFNPPNSEKVTLWAYRWKVLRLHDDVCRIYWGLARAFFAFNFLSYFLVFFPFFLLSLFYASVGTTDEKLKKSKSTFLVINCVVLACQLLQMAQNRPK
jgi:hypothetical protein